MVHTISVVCVGHGRTIFIFACTGRAKLINRATMAKQRSNIGRLIIGLRTIKQELNSGRGHPTRLRCAKQRVTNTFGFAMIKG